MVSALYWKGSRILLGMVVLTFPLLWWQSTQIRQNNDIETWLPQDTEVRQEYEKFKADFGVDEVILVGLEDQARDPRLVEGIATRIESIAGVRKCWTSARFSKRMLDWGVPPEEVRARLTGLTLSENDHLEALLVVLTMDGAKDRVKIVSHIRDAIHYCQLDRPQASLSGAPVVVSELDRLGGTKATLPLFLITVAVCLLLLQYSIRHWPLSLSVLGVTLWSIYLTQSVIVWCGGEMNFIMGALSVMVMICTLSIAVHLLSYYSSAKAAGDPDPLSHAIRESWNPCFLSTLTTLLGLVSLNVCHILPVSQFGYAAALGSIVSMVVGLGITPALITIWPDYESREREFSLNFRAWGAWLGRWRISILTAGMLVLFMTGLGLTRLQSRIQPVEFLPANNPVVTDLMKINAHLTSIESVEAVVDFGLTDIPFVERLNRVRTIQDLLSANVGVRHSLSAASFFPRELPDNALDLASLFNRVKRESQADGFIAQDERKWRITLRLRHGAPPEHVLADLQKLKLSENVTYTGVAPLLANAQREIFEGFWQSFTAALLTISLVMIISLRSITLGIIAMVPNVMPIWFVFGIVGYLGLPVDIGMMMTGSIALGISVDCTFHFLVTYRQSLRSGRSNIEACQDALEHTGAPMIESSFMSALGMLALCLSSFTPTARFGWLMAAQMIASILGEMCLLPTLLTLLGRKKKLVVPAPTNIEEPFPNMVPKPYIIKPRSAAPRLRSREVEQVVA